jgi:hypothetical protein
MMPLWRNAGLIAQGLAHLDFGLIDQPVSEALFSEEKLEKPYVGTFFLSLGKPNTI